MTKSKRNVLFIILGAILVIGAVVGVCLIVNAQNASAGDNKFVKMYYPELLKEGRYYQGGDENSAFYFEVKGGKISLHGDRDKLVQMVFDNWEKMDSETADKSQEYRDNTRSQAEKTVDYDMQEQDYVVFKTRPENAEDSEYMLITKYDKEAFREDAPTVGTGYFFNGADTIEYWSDSPFVLVK